MLNITWPNYPVYQRPENHSRVCAQQADIITWKACHENALELEKRGVNRKIKTASLVLMAIGIISSSLVCMVVIRIRRVPQRTISNALILNLAIADILFRIVFVITRLLVPTLHIKISFYECKIMLYSHYACAAVTFASLAWIAIDRYQQIVYPLKYFYMSTFHRVVIILSLWVYAGVVAMGFIFVGEDWPYQMSGRVPRRFRRFNSTLPETITYQTKSSKYCALGKNSFSSQLAFTPYFVFAFLTPLLIIIASYAAVFRFLKARSKHNISRITARSKRKVLKMMVVVVACFVVCWAPIMLVDLSRVYGVPFRLYFPLRHFAEAFSHSSSIVSPVIYAFGNANFRKELNKIMRALKAVLPC